MDDCEIIAVLLDEAEDGPRSTAERALTAQCLVRDSHGQMTLHAVESEEEFDETARTSACFRRGKEIRDPVSHEVIGYEMEAVSLNFATRWAPPARCAGGGLSSVSSRGNRSRAYRCP